MTVTRIPAMSATPLRRPRFAASAMGMLAGVSSGETTSGEEGIGSVSAVLG